MVSNASDIASLIRANERVAEVQYGFSEVQGQQIRVFVIPIPQSTRPRRGGLHFLKGPERTEEQIEQEHAREREADRLAGRNTECAKRHAALQKGRMAVQVGQTLQEVVEIMGQPDVIYFEERMDDHHVVVRPGTRADLKGSGSDGFLIYSPFEDSSLRRPYPTGILHYHNVTLTIGRDLRVPWIGSK